MRQGPHAVPLAISPVGAPGHPQGRERWKALWLLIPRSPERISGQLGFGETTYHNRRANRVARGGAAVTLCGAPGVVVDNGLRSRPPRPPKQRVGRGTSAIVCHDGPHPIARHRAAPMNTTRGHPPRAPLGGTAAPTASAASGRAEASLPAARTHRRWRDCRRPHQLGDATPRRPVHLSRCLATAGHPQPAALPSVVGCTHRPQPTCPIPRR